jgi:hypothetical protein
MVQECGDVRHVEAHARVFLARAAPLILRTYHVLSPRGRGVALRTVCFVRSAVALCFIRTDVQRMLPHPNGIELCWEYQPYPSHARTHARTHARLHARTHRIDRQARLLRFGAERCRLSCEGLHFALTVAARTGHSASGWQCSAGCEAAKWKRRPHLCYGECICAGARVRRLDVDVGEVRVVVVHLSLFGVAVSVRSDYSAHALLDRSHSAPAHHSRREAEAGRAEAG